MLKKTLSVLLAVLMTAACMSAGVCAEDATATEPEKTASGYYEGQILRPGDKITSVSKTCETLIVTYGVSKADVPHVTSALQQKYVDPKKFPEAFTGEKLITFRDDIASFTSGEIYAGTYTVKAAGDAVDSMETTLNKYESGSDIFKGLEKDVRKKLEKKKQTTITLTIDYEYEKATYYQYTSLAAWKVAAVQETEDQIIISLEAVYETREPTNWERGVEKAYTKWLAFLDVLGDMLLKIVPKLVTFWATILGNK